jgi:hypothetical protein
LGIIRLLEIVLIYNAHFVGEQMTLLKDPAHSLPVIRGEDIGKIERETFPDSSPCTNQILELDIGTFPYANLASEPVKSRRDIFQGISNEMLRQLFVHGLGQGKFLLGQLQVLGQDMNGIVNSAIGTPSEDPVNGVAERTVIADYFGFELFFTVVLEGMRCPGEISRETSVCRQTHQ